MSAAGSGPHPKRTISALAAQSSAPVEGTASSSVSARGSEVSASSPLPVKKRRRRNKSHNHGSSSPGGDSTLPGTRFAAPPKWNIEQQKESPSKPSSHREAPKTKAFTPGKPTPEYLDKASIPSHRSDPTSLATEATKAKLLILDLNGTLLFRKKLAGSGAKKPYPRPYIPAFLAWIFHPDNALETMIWSSAQPDNVKKMVQVCFGEAYESRLKVIWARDTLGLSKADYYQKVQTVKNLDVVWEELPYSVGNTLLIDDSPLKAHMQPYNHLVLREYDQELFRGRHDSDADETLLAVIGVLSEAIRQSNVAHWIREGGLITPPGSHALGGRERSQLPTGLEPSSLREAEGSQFIIPGKGKEPVHPEHPPSPELSSGRGRSVTSSPVPASNAEILSDSAAEMLAESETLWFQDQDIAAVWAKVGRAELERLGIAADVGPIDGSTEPSVPKTVADNTPQAQVSGGP